MITQERKDRIKKHFRDNKQIYIGAAVQVAIGIVTYKLVSAKLENMKTVVINNNIGGMNNKIKYQTISKYGNVIGRPGIPVILAHAGQEDRYESIRLAAEAIDVPYNVLWKHLRGSTNHVKGYVARFAE